MSGRPFNHPSPSTTSLLPRASPTPTTGSSRPSPSVRSSASHPSSISEKYSLSHSPHEWGLPLLLSTPEPDDVIHNPDPRRDRRNDRGGSVFTLRGIGNLGCLSILATGCLALFAGYPIITHFTEHKQTNQGGFNLGGTNATGQVPALPGNYGLIDRDTPQSAYTTSSYHTGDEMVLVFSDEFNVDGRTFYPGEDPFWEAVDLHYWGTNDLEWYDPGQATTKGGYLQIRLDQVANPADNHNLGFKSGMIQTWNKFCFTGGLILASVMLPGSSTISGFWPAIWTMGNLGRAGFGGTVEGLWPYSYDSCDVGTLPNQTYPGTATPLAAVQNGDPANQNMLSYQPGQRLSACTCPGESHPGPMRADGSYVGRSAPEIDIFEAIVDAGVGKVSLSSQWAPFNAKYLFTNTTGVVTFDDPNRTVLNAYLGGAFQQTTSGLSLSNPNCYELSGGCYTVYGFEYKPGFDNSYITWINDNQRAWTILVAAMGPDAATEISARQVPAEPMYIIANLGFSQNFGDIVLDTLTFPATMSVDWIRVYQPKNSINIGCDPVNFPTAAYIDTYYGAYTNPNVTTWAQFNQSWPKNRLMPAGCN